MRSADCILDDGYSYDRLDFTEPSTLGTIKAMAVYEARGLKSTNSDCDSVLVVAVRGSASKVDHMVNINTGLVKAGEFIVSISSLGCVT